MQRYQKQFIQFAIQQHVLQFGDFTLKSGRKSPYFFNAGLFNTGKALKQLGEFYAQAIHESDIQFDILFGPAYKGISLACATAIAFAEQYDQDIPFCFNRKEQKDHGEGGQLIGSPLKGRALLIDDVITAGTAFRESNELISHFPAEICGAMVAIDRQERGQGQASAIVELQAIHNIPIFSIITLSHILDYLTQQPDMKTYVKLIETYQQHYGA